MKHETKETLRDIGCVIPVVAFVLWMLFSNIKDTIEIIVSLVIGGISFFIIYWPVKLLIKYVGKIKRIPRKWTIIQDPRMSALGITTVVLIVIIAISDPHRLLEIIMNFIY